MLRKLVTAVVVLVIMGFSYMSYQMLTEQKKSPHKRSKPEAKNYVRVQAFEPETIAIEIEEYGRVGSTKKINVIAEVGGRLTRGAFDLKKGQRFRKGNLLCRINSVEEKLNLKAQKSKFLNTLASILPDLRIDFPKSYQVWQAYFDRIDLNNKIPAIPVPDTSKEKTFLAAKNILSEYYAIKSAEEHLRKYSIYAPYNGSIVSVDYQIGSVVNSGAKIASIISTDHLELEVPVETKDIQFVQRGKKVKVINESNGIDEWTGTISRVADFVDPNSQSISVFIAINKKNRYEVLDGLFLRAIIPGKSVSNAVEVPRRILKNKNEVFVVQDSVLVTKQVVVHKLSKNKAIISGLDNGDLMVIDRPSSASENMKVEVVVPKN